MRRSWLGVLVLAAGFLLPACGVHPSLPPGDIPPKDQNRGYVGLPKQEAISRAGHSELPWRVIEEDGRSLPVTLDLRPDRLNFTVRNGVVIKVTSG